MKDFGISLRGWKVLRSSSNNMISMRDTCPEDVKNKLMRRAKGVHWQTLAKQFGIEELKEGVWFEPIKA